MTASAARARLRARREEPRALEVVVFDVGHLHFAAARAEVAGTRPSRRVKMLMTGDLVLPEIPMVSLSAVLGLDRDTSVDRRVLEVEYFGRRIGLEVTAIAGIRQVPAGSVLALPPVAARHCASRAVLGLVEIGPLRAVALDLQALLIERGVDVPD